MSEYKKTLIAIDLYGSPEQVLSRATSIIGDQKSTVHVLNVIPDPAYMYIAYPDFAAATTNFDWDAQRKNAQTQIVDLTKKAGLPGADVIVKTGNATTVTLEQAQELEADLIILGSHGRHGIKLLLGSTANGVLHRAECDVLAVRLSAAEVPEE